MKLSKTTLAAVIGCAVVGLLIGGWFTGGHFATKKARDTVEGALIRSGMNKFVRYDSLSATVLGTVTLKNVELVDQQGLLVSAKNVVLFDLDEKGGLLKSLEVQVEDYSFPILDITRRSGGYGTFSGGSDLFGMGYTTIQGDLGFSFKYDDGDRVLKLKLSSDTDAFIDADCTFELANVDRELIASMGRLYSSMNGANWMAGIELAMKSSVYLLTTKLANYSLSVDTEGVIKRAKQVTATSLPGEEEPLKMDISMDEMVMIQAGMSPSNAREMITTLDKWGRSGGRIVLKSNLESPVDLFQRGNLLPEPAFSNPETFLALTRSSAEL